MQYGFHFDGTRCTGCKTCMLACKDYHDLSCSVAFRQVYEYGGGTWRQDDAGAWHADCFTYYVSNACCHCGDPVCTHVCPTGAMHKDADTGLVSVDIRRCIGCGYCALSCPYRAPSLDRRAGHSVKCDGCKDRVVEGKMPVCVEACPLRALDFGDIEELRSEFGDVASVSPLPDSSVTRPNIVITPPVASRAVGAEGGSVSNRYEIV